MAWTFAHPAAVLPLARLCPRWLNFPALVVGSLTPDLGYYLYWWSLSGVAHAFPGGLLVCVLSGFCLLAVFYLLRAPVCHLLPQPHRDALLPLTRNVPARTPTLMLAMAISLVLGTATHIAWDAFTHRGGWGVLLLPVLQQPVFRLQGMNVPAYDGLQLTSSLVGLAAMAWAYRGWLRNHRGHVSVAAAGEDGWRYALLVLLGVSAALAALITAGHSAARLHGRILFYSFAFHFLVQSVMVFAGLLAACAVLAYALRRRVVRHQRI